MKALADLPLLCGKRIEYKVRILSAVDALLILLCSRRRHALLPHSSPLSAMSWRCGTRSGRAIRTGLALHADLLRLWNALDAPFSRPTYGSGE